MASAGIQFVPSANASSGPNGPAALVLGGDSGPIDFAAMLFAAQTAIPPELAELAGAGADAMLAEGSDDTADTGAAPDLALLLGGLIAPAVAVESKPAPVQDALAPATEETTGKPGRGSLTLVADAEAIATAELVAKDGKSAPAANLADPLISPPQGSPAPGEAHHFGHLLAATPPTSGPQPQGGAPIASAHVASALHDPQWGQDFSQRIVWMARSELQSAHLSLNPANLGPIEVTLNLGAEHATAVFSSPHGEVREALEAALPRLREMLAGAGISLGDAQVNSQSQRDLAQSGHPGSGHASNRAAEAILAGDDAVNTKEGSRIRVGRGLVDTFA